MDAFFASVEQLDAPHLKGKCVVVGGASQRGVVAAASYEARRYGIHSAMPIFQARQRCPHLVIVPPRRKRYAELSRKIMSILSSYSPLVEPISIDEAYVDVTSCRRLSGPPQDIAKDIKQRISSEIGLTCSVGVAPNKFLAKIASDLEKPDGLTVIHPRQVNDFIRGLPIGKVPGVGRRTLKMLTDLGVTHLGQVRQFDPDILVAKLGKFGHRLVALAHGDDPASVTPIHDTKSVGSETTLSRDTRDPALLASHLLAQSQSVARQLRGLNMGARVITLKIKTGDFKRHTRSRTLPRPVRDSESIYREALKLLALFKSGQLVRLVGVAASGLQSDDVPVQAGLFDDPSAVGEPRKWEKVERVVDAISHRYGEAAVKRGTLTSR